LYNERSLYWNLIKVNTAKSVQSLARKSRSSGMKRYLFLENENIQVKFAENYSF